MNSLRTSTLKSALGFAVACAALTAAAGAVADEITVPLDHVQLVTFKGPMRMVFVGNPAIADINVIDNTHVFVLGKTYGATNIIGIDSSGQEGLNEQIVVTDRPGQEITVHRGIFRTTMMCTSDHCQAAPAPGDNANPPNPQTLADPSYEALLTQADKRQAASRREAGEK